MENGSITAFNPRSDVSLRIEMRGHMRYHSYAEQCAETAGFSDKYTQTVMSACTVSIRQPPSAE